MSQLALTQAVYDKLTGDLSAGSVYQLLLGRVYHLRPPDRTPLAWLGFTLSQEAPRAYFGVSDDVEAQVTMSIWSPLDDGLGVAQAINDQLHTQLHRQSISIEGLSNGQMLCMVPGVASVDQQAYVIHSTWKLWASVA
jgi:hypothetical protein